MTDLIFLKALRDKLKGGNIRSIHLNALPGRYATRLDLANLNYIKPGIAEKFLYQLLSQSCFEFQISFDGIDLNSIQPEEQKKLGLLSKRLNSLNIENEDNYKEHGIKTFGFGFPILIKPSKQDPKKIIKAPLFIWQLELIKASNKVNTWSILRNKIKNETGKIVDEEVHSVGLNEVLLSFIKNDRGIIIPQINEELLEDAIIDKSELLDECFKVLKALNANSSEDINSSLQSKFDFPIENIPDAASLESIGGNTPWIHFGGVFGLYRTQKESIITDIDRLIDRFNDFDFENLQVENFSGTAHSAIETDPSQQEILSSLGIETNKIIQGPPGTGKSQSLTALITNALANNLKCLVVCEKKTALEVIKTNLHTVSNQLGELAAVVEDINKDRDGIVNSVRDRLGNLSQFAGFNQTTYNNNIQTIETKAEELNKQHKDLDKKIYQGKTWTELVGLFLRKQKGIDFSGLKEKLDYKKFQFQNNEAELPELISKLKTAKKLYSEINRLDHPLEVLHHEIFKQDIPKAIQLHLEEIEKAVSPKVATLKRKLQTEIVEYRDWIDNYYKEIFDQIGYLIETLNKDINEYKNWIDNHYENYFIELKLKIKEYQSFGNLNYERFGNLFFRNDMLTKFRINLACIFSNKYKELKSARMSLVENISDIKEAHLSLKYFEHTYFEENNPYTLNFYIDNINLLSTRADTWHENVGILKDDYIHKFSSECIHPKYDSKKDRIAETEKMFDSFNTFVSQDKKLSQPTKETKNHLLKINALNNLIKQLSELEIVKSFFINKLASDEIHIHCRDKANLIRETENQFTEIIDFLNNEQILKRSTGNLSNHHERISEAETLLADLKIITQNLEDFREYFDWKKFYLELTPIEQTLVKLLIEIGCEDWEMTFECWYYYWLLAIAESKLKFLPKNDDKIHELFEANENLKTNQIRSIISNWSIKQYQSTRKSQSEGISPISLFNRRGSRGERRNSLRKIITTDFELFTDFFPVTMVSPTVCSSIIPLIEGLFDIVIFDEASQLRLEDTFPSLLRGKIKVVSGDSQQMPPSNFFQGGTALLNPTDGDYEDEMSEQQIQESTRNINNSLDLADSESLLVYAENCNYKQSYLKVHYRSHHPYLIDFSNHAFYGKRLIPMPAKQAYKPIQYIEVNGLYEDQVNRDEARQVVDILLHHIKPFKSGKYPSVGVATFNLYQRNLILEEITRVRQQSPEYDKKITDLGQDLFVKNLENIQGDERDIIIISTTFGKRADGSFRQQFGPILQRNGYKLLNVIVTRAKFKVYVCTSIPQEHINHYPNLLKQFKNNGRAIFYSYLAYAKFVSDNNNEAREALLKQLYDNCDSRSFDIEHDVYGSESPFEEEIYYRLAEKIGQERLEQQYRIGGFRIDLVIKSKKTGNPIIAIECDGAKYHSSNEAYAWDMFRQSRLEKQGFIFYRIWSTNWWYSEEKELRKLVEFINKFDREEKQEEETIVEDALSTYEIIPAIVQFETKRRVSLNSIVTVKNPEGKVLKVRFSKIQSSQKVKPDQNGILTIYEKSPLALAIVGRTQGDTCQLGMLELYYEIVSVETG